MTKNIHRKRRKILVIGGAVTVTVFIGAYLAYSVIVWSDFEQRAADWKHAASTQIDNIANESSASDKVLTGMKSLIAKSEHQCDPPRLAAWQASVVSSWQRAVEQCRDGNRRVQSVVDAMSHVVNFVDDEKQMNDRLVLATQSLQVKNLTAKQAVSAWGELRHAFEGMTLKDEHSRPVYDLVARESKNIHTEYTKLQQADTKKDGAAYKEQYDVTQKAQRQFERDVIEVREATYAKLLDELQQARQAL